MSMLISTFNLPRRCTLRQSWRRYGSDPQTVNICRVIFLLSTAVLAIMAVLILPGFIPPLGNGLFGTVVTGVPLFGMIMGGMYGFNCQRFDHHLLECLHCAGLEDVHLTYALTWPQIQDTVRQRVRTLADCVQGEEQRHPLNPYHHDRVNAIKEFETAFDLAERFGFVSTKKKESYFIS